MIEEDHLNTSQLCQISSKLIAPNESIADNVVGTCPHSPLSVRENVSVCRSKIGLKVLELKSGKSTRSYCAVTNKRNTHMTQDVHVSSLQV